MPELLPLCPTTNIELWFGLLWMLFVFVSLFSALLVAAVQSGRKKRD